MRARSTEMLRKGATLDRYRIEVELGAGGMGRVYRAFDTRLLRLVALKVLLAPGEQADGEVDPDLAVTQAESHILAVTQLLREARAAAALSHPNVVAVFDVGEASGLPFIAMEFVAGTSLGAFIGDPSVTLQQRVRWLADVARALGAAHRAGIVHRDVKPANVLVREDGAVKVVDFGIARWSAPESRRTKTGGISFVTEPKILGTPHYMAPEQIRGELVDGRTDQFAWGVVAYELLGGRSPWTVTGVVAVIGMIVSREPEPLHDIAPEVPRELSALISRALRKDADERFPSMDELLAELEPMIGGARAGSTSERVTARRAEGTNDAPTVNVVALEAAERADPSSGARRLELALATPTLRASDPAAGIEEPAGAPPPGGFEPGGISQPPSHATPGGARSVWPQLAPPGARWRLGAVLLGLFAITAVLVFVAGRGPGDPAPTSAPTPASAAGPTPTRLTDLPPPQGCNPQATAAHSAALGLMRDGNYEQAVRRFEEAADADPSCAAAQLRLAATGHFFLAPQRALHAYQRALQLRRQLSERDQGLLDAYEPLILRDPPDRDELSARLLKLVERFPGDAEIVISAVSEARPTPEERLALARRAVEIDPAQSDAWQNLGKALALIGRKEEAIEALERCLTVAPLSTDCLWQRIEILREDGQCNAMEADARRMIARSPETSQGYAMLAAALAAEGAPGETVEEVLGQRWVRLPEPERRAEQIADQVKLASLTGALDRAEARAGALEDLVQRSTDLSQRVRPLRLLAEVRMETGRDAEAAKLAEDFARRRRAWTRRVDTLSSPHRDDFYDEVRLLALARDSGAIDGAMWNDELARWQQQARRSLKRADEPTLWTVTAAMPARDAVEAAEAFAAFPGGFSPPGAPPTRFAAVGFPDAFTGHALLLAGRAQDAVAYLRRATASCTAFDYPILHTRAQLWLAQALERAGDKAGACAANAAVLKRWGDAKPRSVTADDARRRMKALGCDVAK